ncbi:DUF1552 domain-containing protein [Bremerella sp.]|uniref:DUF1552 domain-containing protein n=1 Tax=Bremerella sp. TaxID=2795602 RepID=UPI003919E4A1
MNLTRRNILHGLSLGASSVLLTPFLRHLSAEEAGRFEPKRIVFVMEGNGFNPNQAQPVTIPRKSSAQSRNDISQLQDIPLADHKLSEAMQPLTPFKDRLTVIQGLSSRICGGGHSNNFGALGVYSSKAGAFGETIDMALAKALPSIFPQVGLGISDKPEHSIIYNTSVLERGKKVPTQCRPDLAYQQLFGSVADGAAAKTFHAKTNLLDFMVDDVKRLQRQLNTTEREKLGNYLSAFESMRNRQGRLLDHHDTLQQNKPHTNDKYFSDVETDRLEAQFDIGAAALISGLTNVLTLASGCGDPYFSVKFTGLGINFGKHSIGHGQSYNGMTWEQLSTKIRQFHFQQMANLADKLQRVPEGNGTMLDNTVIIYLSDAAEGHHSRCWEWPMVVLGDLGGRLNTRGRYLCYPRYGETGHRTVANFYTTLLHAAGAPRDRFGQRDPQLDHLDQDGPLDELMT